MTGGDPDGSGLLALATRILARESARGFAGPDPYDGLNSRLLSGLLPRSRTLRLAVIQAVKRSPFDPRPLLRIPPTLNPKGAALFLSGLHDLPAAGKDPETIPFLQRALVRSASLPDGSPAFPGKEAEPGDPGVPADLATGWGYSFPWQSRAFYQPAGFPTVVCTHFVVEALCDSGAPRADLLLAAAARFVTRSLRRHSGADGVCYSYSPRDDARVYNASLFAARILVRRAAAGSEDSAALRAEAGSIADYVAARQSADGSWFYGEAPHWRWVDNLHTGFVLESLILLGRSLGRTDWDDAIRAGLRFYAENLFTRDGTALYFPGRRIPLDPHSFAQGILTWLAAERNGFEVPISPERIAGRAVDLLWDARREGFRLRRFRHDPSRTIYSRWSQAWMFRALASLLKGNGPA